MEETQTNYGVSVEVSKTIQQIYENTSKVIFDIYNIFKEFFSEENVELQNFSSLKTFTDTFIDELVGDLLDKYDCPFSDEEWSNIKYCRFSKVTEDIQLKILTSSPLLNYFPSINILVHFPQVRVTNEHGNFTDIKHLYTKTYLSYDGKLNSTFTMCKSEYTLIHFLNGYIHSHVPQLNRARLGDFNTPCLGEGPLNHTIDSLKDKCDLDLWALYCLEMSKYVTVESLEGIPYKYLERMHTSETIMGSRGYAANTSFPYISNSSRGINAKNWTDFIRSLLESNKLKYSFINGSYTIGLPYIECMLLISNEFIKWYNKAYNQNKVLGSLHNIVERGILKHCMIDNGKIYIESEDNSLEKVKSYIGTYLFTFKNKPVTLEISDLELAEVRDTYLILSSDIVSYILNIILKVINHNYERKNSNTTSSSQEVKYI